MAENVYQPCENPCPGCPSLWRLHKKARNEAAQATTAMAKVGFRIEEEHDGRRYLQARAEVLAGLDPAADSEFVTQLEEAYPFLKDLAGGRVAGLGEEIEGHLEEEAAHAQALAGVEQTMAEAAEHCPTGEPRRWQIGPVTVRMCRSDVVPLRSRFGISDI